jgi:hypothetical protein
VVRALSQTVEDPRYKLRARRTAAALGIELDPAAPEELQFFDR